MKFLVIGLGSIGMRHAKNLKMMGHDVISYDIKWTEKEALKTDWKTHTLNIGGPVDACIICSPTEFHSEHINYAAQRGWHIFVEKPIAYAQDDFLDLGLELARNKGLVVMVGNMLRFHPNVMMAKSLIKKPKSAFFHVLQKNNKPAYRRDGVLLNWGAHEIDLALYLLGPAKVVGAEVQEDAATVALEHDSGATSIIAMDYLTEPEKRGFEIDDEDGHTHEINLTLHDWNPIYMAEMEEFIERITFAEKWDPPLNRPEYWKGATGEDGLATLRLIEKAKEMAAHDKG